MKRQIKFRVWDKKDNKMSAPFELQEREIYYRDEKGVYMADTYDLDCGDFEVMQYTGSKDKNDMEIYEGDIVAWNKGNIQFKDIVTYEKGCFRLNNFFMSSFDDTNDAFREGINMLYVVGNTYENQELLK